MKIHEFIAKRLRELDLRYADMVVENEDAYNRGLVVFGEGFIGAQDVRRIVDAIPCRHIDIEAYCNYGEQTQELMLAFYDVDMTGTDE